MIESEYIQFKKNKLKFNEKNYGLSSIEVNITELCNRKCNFCPRSSFYPNLNLNMTIESSLILKNRLDEFNFSGSITFSGNGEPLLNKNVYEIIFNLKKYKPFLITNGDSILKNEKIIDQLFLNGLDILVINEYDSNENYDKKIKMIKGRSIIVKNQFKFPLNYTNRKRENLQNLFEDKICFFPFYKTVVDYNLNVRFCNNDWKHKVVVGNLEQSSLKDIWLSDYVNRMRKHLMKGERKCLVSCHGCNVNGTFIGEKNYEYFKTRLDN